VPTTLYLYNSKDPAAENFYISLKRDFEGTKWELKADFDGALDNIEGGGYDRLAQALTEFHSVIYAVGPRGAGAVQGRFERNLILKAETDAALRGQQWKIVVALLDGAQVENVPPALQGHQMHRDNAHLGGMSVADSVFKEITGRERPQNPRPAVRVISDVKDVTEATKSIVRGAARHGLTVFVGPYAASDVHGAGAPTRLGSELLKKFGIENDVVDDLLSQPWTASEAIRLLKSTNSYDDISDALRDHVLKVNRDGGRPLPLDGKVADLAAEWHAASVSAAGQERRQPWSGLLLVTMDQHIRLETALCARNLTFGRLRYSVGGRLCFDRVVPDVGGPAVTSVWELKPGEREAGRSDLDTNFGTVLLVKLMDCVNEGGYPLLTAAHHMSAARRCPALPNKVFRQLGHAPFLMLGGGLLDPLLALAFETHFRPGFDEASGRGSGSRYVVLQPSSGDEDKYRFIEQEADAEDTGWTRDVFGLERIDWPILHLLDRVRAQFAVARRSVDA
jgi:hypothetical protein